MNFVQTFAFNASGTLTWVADQDYVLTAIAGQVGAGGAGNILVTTDATLSIATVTASNRMFNEIIEYAGGAANAINYRSGLSVPILKDSYLVVRANMSAVISLYLEQPAETTAT